MFEIDQCAGDAMIIGNKQTRELIHFDFGDTIDAGTAVGVRFRNIAAAEGAPPRFAGGPRSSWNRRWRAERQRQEQSPPRDRLIN
jgi:hypothetical protein